MINYSLISKSMHWPARSKQINKIVINILKFKEELYFDKKINYTCNLILVNDKFIKKMNIKFRKKNQVTDVLTFINYVNFNNKKITKICDIFLSAEIIKKDAKKNSVSFYDHLTHLIIHSFLHINGFVHKKISDFNKMKMI